MRKKISSNLFICLLVTILVCIIIYSDEVIECVGFSISIWRDNLFPSLFPFFVVSNLLLQYDFVGKISFVFKKIMPNFFHLPKEACFPLIVSLFSGFPSGAKATTDLVKNNILTDEQGSRLLTFTHYSNPLFILGFIGNIVLGNRKIGFIILISHVLTNFIVGFLFRPKDIGMVYKNNISVKTTKLPSLGKALKDSIFDSLNTMFLLLGIVTIFLIITTIISKLFSYGPLLNSLIAGLLEMTQGVKAISVLSVPLIIKIMFITIFISFGGISVHVQVLSIISETKIKYKYFLLARIIHAILATILVSILYLIFF